MVIPHIVIIFVVAVAKVRFGASTIGDEQSARLMRAAHHAPDTAIAVDTAGNLEHVVTKHVHPPTPGDDLPSLTDLSETTLKAHMASHPSEGQSSDRTGANSTRGVLVDKQGDIVLPEQCKTARPIAKQADRLLGDSHGKTITCDTQLDGGWYFYEGYQIPTSVPSMWQCGTHAPGYLTEDNPDKIGETKDIKLCYWWSSSKCQWNKFVSVTNCGQNFVYKLPKPPVCHLQDCFEEASAINCVWNKWEEWKPCDKTCGGGKKSRGRTPVPGNAKGSKCSGETEGQEDCAKDPCPTAAPKAAAHRQSVCATALALAALVAAAAAA